MAEFSDPPPDMITVLVEGLSVDFTQGLFFGHYKQVVQYNREEQDRDEGGQGAEKKRDSRKDEGHAEIHGVPADSERPCTDQDSGFCKMIYGGIVFLEPVICPEPNENPTHKRQKAQQLPGVRQDFPNRQCEVQPEGKKYGEEEICRRQRFPHDCFQVWHNVLPQRHVQATEGILRKRSLSVLRRFSFKAYSRKGVVGRMRRAPTSCRIHVVSPSRTNFLITD